jgi:hypothetical protein
VSRISSVTSGFDAYESCKAIHLCCETLLRMLVDILGRCDPIEEDIHVMPTRETTVV